MTHSFLCGVATVLIVETIVLAVVTAWMKSRGKNRG